MTAVPAVGGADDDGCSGCSGGRGGTIQISWKGYDAAVSSQPSVTNPPERRNGAGSSVTTRRIVARRH